MPQSSPQASGVFNQEAEAVCRCGLKVLVGYMDPVPGVADGQPVPAAMHETPYCREYVEMDLVDYLRWRRSGDA